MQGLGLVMGLLLLAAPCFGGDAPCKWGSKGCQCRTGDRCNDGLTCEDGMCVAGDAPAAVDAGPDAGAAIVDASMPSESQREAPAQFDPSEPGYLVIGPPGIVLGVGDTAQLTARVVANDGSEVSPLSLQWTSEQPSIVAVDGTGLVTGQALGAAEITVVEASYGERRLTVSVADPLPTGATGVQFTPPVLAVQVGVEATVDMEVNDAAGQSVAAPSGLTLAASGSAMLSVQAGGQIQASSAGSASVHAEVNGDSLAGSLLVIATDDAPAATFGSLPASSSGCGDWSVLSCSFSDPPRTFTRPGLSDVLRLNVVRTRNCDASGSRWSEYEVTQEAPAELEIYGSDAVNLGSDGSIRAVAPGFTTVLAFVDSNSCDCAGMKVLPDLQGDWVAECDNGDTAQLSFGSWPNRIVREGTPTYGFGVVNVDGSGQFCNEGEGFSCSESANVRGDLVFADGHVSLCAGTLASNAGPTTFTGRGSCASLGGCEGPTFQHCADDRHFAGSGGALVDGSTILSADRFSVGSCTYTSGTAECDTAGPIPPDVINWKIGGSSYSDSMPFCHTLGGGFSVSGNADCGAVCAEGMGVSADSVTGPGTYSVETPVNTSTGDPIASARHEEECWYFIQSGSMTITRAQPVKVRTLFEGSFSVSLSRDSSRGPDTCANTLDATGDFVCLD